MWMSFSQFEPKDGWMFPFCRLHRDSAIVKAKTSSTPSKTTASDAFIMNSPARPGWKDRNVGQKATYYPEGCVSERVFFSGIS
ncbi:MAG: hypothetical protein EBR81_14480 [Proteobacteria bacterium]|nr:hypothetical protein [Pseudomonadota bacterium]